MASLTDCGVGVKVVFLLMMRGVLAQDTACYSAGSVAGAVVGTLLATLAVVGSAYLLWWIYWRSRRGKHLVLVTDPERAGDQFAFDNPCFKDGTPIGRTTVEKEPAKLDQKARWSPWNALVGNRTADKRRALDDSFVGEPRVNVVALRSHDFTGLGFNICGNMRDGIFVKDVLHRGPASESGRIAPGDRIDGIRISFRHMVFEDALTILSYASPYDVQLEVENSSNSCPNTLIRTKRTSGSGIAPADRICHPFYRSQSIADLAQIGKASLKRMQQMGLIDKSPCMEAQGDESGDYPTLRLSSIPAGSEARKENIKLEKTVPLSGIAIVKPERAKKIPTKGTTSPPTDLHSQESPSQEGSAKDPLSKFQKFGVRVLPDSNVGPNSSGSTYEESAGSKQSASGEHLPDHRAERPVVEAEHKQNEHNSIIEKVGEGATAQMSGSNPHSGQMSSGIITSSDVDGVGGKHKPNSFHYDERGIDVGPSELQRSHPKHHLIGHQAEEGKHSGESNVKNLLTKGLQNLKDKLHHNDKKKNGSQIPETSTSTEQEVQNTTGQPASPYLPEVVETELSRMNEKENEGKPQQHESKQDSQEGEIPTEVPEEVCRAAMAARSNRKSLGNVVVDTRVEERKVTASQDGPSGGSSSEGEDTTTTGNMDSDSLGRTPKRPNKRKAPPPPPEESEEKSTSAGQSPYLRSDRDTEKESLSSVADKQRMKDSTVQRVIERHTDVENIQMADDIVALPLTGKITSFTDTARQSSNTDVMQREITNITIESSSNKTLKTDFTTLGTSVTGNQSSDRSPGSAAHTTHDPKPLQQHLDYDIGVNVSSTNSDSDSDLEQLEGYNGSYEGIVEGKKTKKGGTTIELNSSHITIHHSPTSDTVQLESDSTRKAASLGDLSRLDSEQSMSILERAVSLDLADGGTPHSSKKRKAPLPPPGEDYHGGMPDGEDGIGFRKEPRLDNAMDTFQRRRLKKSSDWGTLEEALMQSDRKNLNLQTSNSNGPTEDSLPLQNTVNMLKINPSDQSPKSDEKVEIDTATSLPTLTSHPGITRTDILNVDDVGYSTVLEYGSSGTDNIEHMENESPQHQKKTVLRISPEPGGEQIFSSTASQVTIASGSFSTTPTYRDTNSVSRGEAASTPWHHTDAAQAFSTKLAGSHSSAPSIASDLSSPWQSGSSSSAGLISSTPVSHGGDPYSTSTAHNGGESAQSPVITASHAGISSVHVVSSTTHNDVTEPDSTLDTSVTEPFITAVDSTTSTLAGEISKDDDVEDATWEQDSQPPELPTSPVPVLSQLSLKPSQSMTYITEIQVVTTADSTTSNVTGESLAEEQQTRPADVSSSTVTQRVLKYISDANLSTDSFKSEGSDKEADTVHSVVAQGGAPQKGNVTVTAIRSTVSRIPMRITADRMQSTVPSVSISSNNANHTSNIEERRVKPARPPVPPRKSDSITSSTVATEGSGSGRAFNCIQQLPTESIQFGPTADSSSGKFISFSSLPHQFTAPTESNANRNSTSFEQWVFLDDGSTSNGLEEAGYADDSSSVPHSTVVSLPARTQSVTHIVLDSNQSNGSHGKP